LRDGWFFGSDRHPPPDKEERSDLHSFDDNIANYNNAKPCVM